MKVAVRVDASPRIGSGHLVRCVTLASELRARGAEVIFIVRDQADGWDTRVSAAGFRLTRLPRPERDGPVAEDDYAGWLGVAQERDAEETRAAVGSGPVDLLIVDHYALDATWERRLRPIAGRIVAIDDLANRPHDVDVLVDQGIKPYGSNPYSELVPTSCRLLLGPGYALLDPAFQRARKKYAQTRQTGRTLVFFGAADDYPLIKVTLEALTQPDTGVHHIDLVIRDPLSSKEALPPNASKNVGISVHGQQPSLADIVARCDVAVGAAGTAMWERMCVGVPSIVVLRAANQRNSAEFLHSLGAVVNVGSPSQDFGKILTTSISRLACDQKQALRMRDLGRALVDGQGLERVSEALNEGCTHEPYLRNATRDDVGTLWVWANDPTARSQAINSDPIEWNDHVQWFSVRISQPSTRMYILQTVRGVAVGMIRFDLRDATAHISYYLDAAVRGRGWGAKLIHVGLQKARSDPSFNATTFAAVVRPSNHPSRAVFERLGFSASAGRQDGKDVVRYVLGDSEVSSEPIAN